MGGATALLALSDRDHLSCVMSGHTDRCSCGGTSAPSASDMECRLGLICAADDICALVVLGGHIPCRLSLGSADCLQAEGHLRWNSMVSHCSREGPIWASRGAFGPGCWSAYVVKPRLLYACRLRASLSGPFRISLLLTLAGSLPTQMIYRGNTLTRRLKNAVYVLFRTWRNAVSCMLAVPKKAYLLFSHSKSSAM